MSERTDTERPRGRCRAAYRITCGGVGPGCIHTHLDQSIKKKYQRSKIEKEDRGVGSSPLGSRSIMSSPSLHRKENHYSNDAVEKANEDCEKHENSTLDHFLRKDEDDFNFF